MDYRRRYSGMRPTMVGALVLMETLAASYILPRAPYDRPSAPPRDTLLSPYNSRLTSPPRPLASTKVGSIGAD